jgi:hypothetical protein
MGQPFREAQKIATIRLKSRIRPGNPGLMVVVVGGGVIDVWREKKLMWDCGSG